MRVLKQLGVRAKCAPETYEQYFPSMAMSSDQNFKPKNISVVGVGKGGTEQRALTRYATF